jgi:hypothetical protein
MKIYKWRYSAKGDRNNEKFSNATVPDSPSKNTRSRGNNKTMDNFRSFFVNGPKMYQLYKTVRQNPKLVLAPAPK